MWDWPCDTREGLVAYASGGATHLVYRCVQCGHLVAGLIRLGCGSFISRISFGH